MTFDLFRTFHHVAQLRSFTKAAEHMGTSQPNVSMRIRKLELQIGHKLFIRSHPLELTENGWHLWGKFRTMMIEYESLLEEVKHESWLTN